MENNPLNSVEWTTCWMAIRYAMNRHSIASISLPHELVKAYGERWSEVEKEMLSNEIKKDLHVVSEEDGFWSDSRTWLKFASYLDIKSHYKVKGIDNAVYDVFDAGDRVYPVSEYVNNPYHEIDLPKENILEIIRN